MKSGSFEYARPDNLLAVFSLLDEFGDDAKILAGGQSLIPAMNMRMAAPEILIDVARVDALKGMEIIGDVLRIGAMSRHIDVMKSRDVCLRAPLISQAMPHIAHTTIRNRGTFGGSLCNADPAAELPACTVALNAKFNIQSSSGVRSLKAEEFFKGTYTTALEATEILVSVDVPIAGQGSLAYFDEIARRKGDYAMAGLAAHAEIQDGCFKSVRLAFFGVSEMPILAGAASRHLSETPLHQVKTSEVCEALSEDIEAFDDLATSAEAKRHMACILLARALTAFQSQERAHG